jgi:hypothetical protein
MVLTHWSSSPVNYNISKALQGIAVKRQHLFTPGHFEIWKMMKPCQTGIGLNSRVNVQELVSNWKPSWNFQLFSNCSTGSFWACWELGRATGLGLVFNKYKFEKIWLCEFLSSKLNPRQHAGIIIHLPVIRVPKFSSYGLSLISTKCGQLDTQLAAIYNNDLIFYSLQQFWPFWVSTYLQQFFSNLLKPMSWRWNEYFCCRGTEP